MDSKASAFNPASLCEKLIRKLLPTIIFVYCTCTCFSGIHILAELAWNRLGQFIITLICSSTMNCNKVSSRCATSLINSKPQFSPVFAKIWLR